MKSSIASAARSCRPFPAVRVDSRGQGQRRVAEMSFRTTASGTSAAEFRRFASEAPTRFRDYMGYHGHVWSSMESDGAMGPPEAILINDALGLIFRVRGRRWPTTRGTGWMKRSPTSVVSMLAGQAAAIRGSLAIAKPSVNGRSTMLTL